MKQFSHDYTKAADAESHLYAAQQLNAHDDPIEAWRHIEDARRLLQEYLAQDNMVPDDDVENGWVRASDAFDDKSQLKATHIMNTNFKVIVETGQGREIHPAASLAKAITIYREQMDQYPQSQIHLLRDMPMQTTNSAAQPSQPKVVRHGQIDRQYNSQLDGAGNPECPLYGKDVRITGTFEQIGMSRDDVAAACQHLGAKSAREGICKSMDIVIIGNNPGPTKQQKIETWRNEGCDIKTYSQFDFKEILNRYDGQ